MVSRLPLARSQLSLASRKSARSVPSRGPAAAAPILAAALMVQEVFREQPKSLLEVGTGSGYVTALLQTVLPYTEIVSVERIAVLAQAAAENLEVWGAFNYGRAPLIVQWADGDALCAGAQEAEQTSWPRHYDVILLTAGTPSQWAESFLVYAPTVIGPIGDTPNDMALRRMLRTQPPTVIDLCAVPGANPLKRGVE